MRDHFWKRFQREVIPVINHLTQWFAKCDPLTVGDVVHVADDMRAGVWKLGRVVEAAAGPDGQVRQAKVRTLTGIVHRPVSKIAKVDVMV